MKEMLGYQVDEVVAALNLGQVKANTIGRLMNGVATYPRVEFLVMEAVLKHPLKTLSEVVSDVHTQINVYSFYFHPTCRTSENKLRTTHITFRPCL